jgi:hypothetical protein
MDVEIAKMSHIRANLFIQRLKLKLSVRSEISHEDREKVTEDVKQQLEKQGVVMHSA